MKKINWGRLILSILICEGAGILGSVATVSSVKGWYVENLVKPSFNPPSWIFGPVWTTLFFLMGLSLYIVWTKKGKTGWFWIQLGLNVLWSLLFFGLKWPLGAGIEILFLWVSILMTILSFNKTSKLAARLLWPYLAWVSFAAFLNLTIVQLN